MEGLKLKVWRAGELAASAPRAQVWVPCLPVFDFNIKNDVVGNNPSGKVYVPHLSFKSHITISYHSPPALHTQNDSATTASLR